MENRIPVIANPKARSTHAAKAITELQQSHPEAELHFTQAAGDATDIAARLVQEGRPRIVAAGGDGTINEVVQGMALATAELHQDTCPSALGILPLGTMNVFSLEMHLPQKLEEAWHIITQGHSRRIDLWKANSHHFIQLAGIGLDAQIIANTTWEAKKKLGPLSYIMSAAQVLGQEAPEITVRTPHLPSPLTGSVALIGNGHYYGGPFSIFKEAQPDDGLLDVLIFTNRNYLDILNFLKAATLTGYQNQKDIHYLQTSELEITSIDPVPAEVDGELIGETPIQIQAASCQLQVITPQVID